MNRYKNLTKVKDITREIELKYQSCLQSQRICHKCMSIIDLDSFIITQDSELTIKKSLDLWLSNIKKFYCCDCYGLIRK